MTVQEFIDKLQTFDPEIIVLVDNGSLGVFAPRVELVIGDAVIFPGN